MVLDAISKDIRDVARIAEATKFDKADVELIVNDLLAHQLVSLSERRKLFRRTSTQTRITKIGSRLLYKKRHELDLGAKALRACYYNSDRKTMESLMDDNRVWIPTMIFSGIMSAALFASMMSFMGMAMNPTEAAMVEDSIAGSEQKTGDNNNIADAQTTDGESQTASADTGADDIAATG
ncbi:MarR family transcriptional regulator [Candidatus Nitrososphaera evergladensis]|nr:MarR family transcriptional regulator [Candidatus Nitrososphaera evergladensis]